MAANWNEISNVVRDLSLYKKAHFGQYFIVPIVEVAVKDRIIGPHPKVQLRLDFRIFMACIAKRIVGIAHVHPAECIHISIACSSVLVVRQLPYS